MASPPWIKTHFGVLTPNFNLGGSRNAGPKAAFSENLDCQRYFGYVDPPAPIVLKWPCNVLMRHAALPTGPEQLDGNQKY